MIDFLSFLVVFQSCLSSLRQLHLVQILAVFMHGVSSSIEGHWSDSCASSLKKCLQPSVLPQDSLREQRIIWYQHSKTVPDHDFFQTYQLCLFIELRSGIKSLHCPVGEGGLQFSVASSWEFPRANTFTLCWELFKSQQFILLWLPLLNASFKVLVHYMDASQLSLSFWMTDHAPVLIFCLKFIRSL